MVRDRTVLTHDATLQLIDEVELRQCLWNSADPYHRDLRKVTLAWVEVSQATGLSEDRARTKWRNIRDMMKKEIRKYQVENAEDYPGKWRFFHRLWFVNQPGVAREPAQRDNDEEDNDNGDEGSTEDNVTETFIKFEESDSNIYLEEEEDPIQAKRKKEDEDDGYDEMFLKSLTPFFKQLNPVRKLVVRSKMQDLLLNEIAAQSSEQRLRGSNWGRNGQD